MPAHRKLAYLYAADWRILQNAVEGVTKASLPLQGSVGAQTRRATVNCRRPCIFKPELDDLGSHRAILAVTGDLNKAFEYLDKALRGPRTKELNSCFAIQLSHA